MTDDELIERAKRAYFRRFGQDAQQPNDGLSEVWKFSPKTRRVVLRNARYSLAEYDFSLAQQRLRYVDD